MASPANTLEYIITVVFNSQSAVLASKQVNKMADDNVKAFQKMDPGAKEVGRTFEGFTRIVKGVETAFLKVNQIIRGGNGAMNEQSVVLERVGKHWEAVEGSTKSSTEAMGKHNQSIGSLAAGFAKLALRAAVVVPIWMIIRTVFGTIQKLISDSLTTWVELSKEMSRVGSTGIEAANSMAYLKTVVLDMSTNSSRGFKEVASAMYQLGSAGLNVMETVQGLPHVMNLAIASFANTEQTAKLVAGAYNVFGTALKDTYTVSAKFKEISNILAYTYAKQQVELEDLSNAMSYVASAAGMMDIDFNTLVTTIGVLNTGMLKGSKAGVALMNSFIQIAAESSKLSDLGVVFDPSKPLDFANVVDQLHDRYGDAALSLTNLKEIMTVFGQRGGRAMAQLIADYDRWKGAIDNAKASYKDFAADFAKVAEKSLPAAWEKMWNSMKASMISSLTGVEGFLVNLMNKIADGLDNKNFVKEWRKNLTPEDITILEKGTPKEKTELRRQLAPKIEVLELAKKTGFDIKLEKLGKEQRTAVMDINEEIKKVIASGGSEVDVQTKVRDIIWDIVKNEKDAVEIADRMTASYMDIAKQAKAVADAPFKFTPADIKVIRDAENAAKYEAMRASGAKDTAVTYQLISDLVDNANDEIDTWNESERKKYEQNKKYVMLTKENLDLQTILNSETNKELLTLQGVAGAEKYVMDIMKARIALTQQAYAQQIEYAMKLRGEMSSVFSDVLMGEEDIGNIGKRVGDSMRRNIADAISNSLSMGILQTGLGEVFGGMGSAFENMFSGPGGMFKGAIIDGATQGAPIIEAGLVDAAYPAAQILGQGMIDAAATIATGGQTSTNQEGVVVPQAITADATTTVTPAGTSTPIEVIVEPTEEEARMNALKDKLSAVETELTALNEKTAAASLTAEQRAEKTKQENIVVFDTYVSTPIKNATEKLITAWDKGSTELIPELKAKEKELKDAFNDPNNFPLSQTDKINEAFTADPAKINKLIEDVTVKPTGTVGMFAPTPELETRQANELQSEVNAKETAQADLYAQMMLEWTSSMNDIEEKVGTGAATGTEKGLIAATPTLSNSLQDAMSSILSMLSGGSGTTAGAAGVFGAAGILGNASGFFATPIGAPESMTLDSKTGKYINNKTGKPQATYGSMFGGAVSSGLMAYSQYQSMTQQGGTNPMYAGAAAGLMGVGGMLMMSGPSPAAGIGMIMVLAGYLMQAFNPSKKTTSEVKESSKTETKQITSKIEVTNKQLELVNRNLVAMRDDLTYIMQQSYYFRERNTEDRFAIDSQRGNM